MPLCALNQFEAFGALRWRGVRVVNSCTFDRVNRAVTLRLWNCFDKIRGKIYLVVPRSQVPSLAPRKTSALLAEQQTDLKKFDPSLK